MIEINLLPEDLRKKKRTFQMPEITLGFLPILIGLTTLLIIIQIILVVIVNINKGVYEKMTEEWETLKPQKESVELTKRENKKTQRMANAIEALIDKRILWSKKLNQVSDLVLPGIWYTKLYIDKKTVALEPQQRGPAQKKGLKLIAQKIEIPYLNIEGEIFAVEKGEELAVIGKFIERLKSDGDFFKDFSNIELDSTELHTIGDTEVMKFNINCYLKEVDRGDGG